jgi:predicted signal transduction protein with EAL and GGDEF domain
LSAPYHLKGHQVTIGASIGIAMLRGSSADADTALKNADLALYRAKSAGRGRFCLFEPGMESRGDANIRPQLAAAE